VQTAATAPLALTTQECSLKRDALYKVRDDRAQELGIILSKRAALETSVKALQSGDAQAYSDLVGLCANLGDIIDSGGMVKQGNDDLVGHLSCLASYHMPSQQLSHTQRINLLSRPSRLTLAWPRLLLLPPLALYGIRIAYNSRIALAELARDAVDTGKRFWNDWILEPLQGIVKTIRAGSEEGMIVNAKGVAADIEVSSRVTPEVKQY
jgi:nuclear-control-of-ATPase protein 2